MERWIIIGGASIACVLGVAEVILVLLAARRSKTAEHEFTFRYIEAVDAQDVMFAESMANSAYKAGCNDALLACRCGTLYLLFLRKDESREQAIASAFADLRKVGFKEGDWSLVEP